MKIYLLRGDSLTGVYNLPLWYLNYEFNQYLVHGVLSQGDMKKL